MNEAEKLAKIAKKAQIEIEKLEGEEIEFSVKKVIRDFEIKARQGAAGVELHKHRCEDSYEIFSSEKARSMFEAEGFSVEEKDDVLSINWLKFEEPAPTEEPIVTEEPVVSEEPAPTEEPIATEEPAPSGEPEITEEPSFQINPVTGERIPS